MKTMCFSQKNVTFVVKFANMKKSILCLLIFLTSMQGIFAQVRKSQAYLNYIEEYKDIAIEEMRRYHIPASITLAQGLLESAAGMSDLVKNGNNHFGIKCHNWTGPTQRHDDDLKNECFRVYETAKESYEDHSKFLLRPRYQSLFSLAEDDYKGWATGLKACGYATSPTYAQQLIKLIESYNLTQYDHVKKPDPFIVKHTAVSKKVRTINRLHPIEIFNDNYYLIAREGDTYQSIGEEVEIDWEKLAKYNEVSGLQKLHEGDRVWLKKKQKKAPKLYKYRPHTVKAGESMYSIAQKYGIRLKYLYKMNHLSPDYEIKPGDVLRIR